MCPEGTNVRKERETRKGEKKKKRAGDTHATAL
jgi:hypothetical protein